MNHKSLLTLLIISGVILALALPFALASQTQLVCLTEGQTLKFSECNVAISDFTCLASNGCQVCATKMDNGVYCQTNPNTCNSQGLQCTSLNTTSPVNTTNPPPVNNTNSSNPVPPIVVTPTFTYTKDIAYITRNPTLPDTRVTNLLNVSGYSFDIIDDDAIPSTNFSKYNIILVMNERINNPNLVPIGKQKSIVANTYFLSNWKLAASAGTQINSQLAKGIIMNASSNITKDLTSPVQLYTRTSIGLNYMSSLPKRSRDFSVILGTNDASKSPVIATLDKGKALYPTTAGNSTAKTVFFGITQTSFWTEDSKKMLINSIKWLKEGEQYENDVPIVASIAPITVTEGELIDFTVNAIDPANLTLNYSISSPKFVVVGSHMTWQTTFGDRGNYNFTISASNGFFTTSKILNVVVVGDNRAPRTNNIPTLSWMEDTNYTLNLSQYFTDDQGEVLTYGLESTSSNDQIGADFNTTSGVIKFIPNANWNGTDWIQFYATDGTFRTVSNIVNLTVTNTNDAPVIVKNIPNMTWNEDTVYTSLDLSEYILDVDSVLSYSIIGNNNISVSVVNNKLRLTTPKDYFGTETISLKATDGTFNVTSNTFTLTVIDMGEPPTLGNLSCQTTLNEDTYASCTLEATDIENNTISFSALSSNTLNCTVDGNILSYVSTKDYNGLASCTVFANDIDGSDNKTLSVTINPVNDAPVINSFSPSTDFVNIRETTSKKFTVSATDVDNSVNVSWYLDNALVATGSSYTFAKPIGAYFLDAQVSDNNDFLSRTWNIVVGDSTQFTCSESGFTCNANQFCPSAPFATSDVAACCPVACQLSPPSFKGASACTVSNSSIAVNILSPSGSNTYNGGESIKVEVEVENNLDKSQDFDLKASLYDLDKESSIEDDSGKLSISSDRSKILDLNLDVPEDFDQNHKYAIFVRAKDEVCNQNYLDIDLERRAHDVQITEFSIPEELTCGDQVEAIVKLENMGRADENMNLVLQSNQLGISQTVSNIKVRSFGDNNDVVTKNILFTVPENVADGRYTFEISSTYGDGRRVTNSTMVQISGCRTTTITNSSSPDKIDLTSVSQGNENITEKFSSTLLIVIIITFVALIVILSIVYHMFTRSDDLD